MVVAPRHKSSAHPLLFLPSFLPSFPPSCYPGWKETQEE